MATHGTFNWNELMTADIAKAKAFYAAVLGWTYSEMPMGDETYTLAFVPGETTPVAGLFPWPADKPGSNDWFAYITVDDAAAAAAAVTAAGGSVLRGPFPVEGVGKIVLAADAAGAAVGFIEPAPM